MFIVHRTYTEEEEEEGRGGSAEDEEVLALELQGRGEGHRGWGGRVIIFSQECPHLKCSLGARSLYICSQLLDHSTAASGPWLCGAICSPSYTCLCVCVGSSVNEACVSKCTRMLPPDYPLTLLITRLCHSSRFCQPTRTNLAPLLCHLFL